MGKKIIISGTGCALADNLYANVDFTNSKFKKYISINNADGGLSPGRLVFTEDLERFANKSFDEILFEITENKPPDSFNIGGPSIVSLINAAQLLYNSNAEIKFYGALGKDKTAKRIIDGLKTINIDLSNYKQFNSPTPFTDVFSDPSYDHGRGERIFVNNIGAAWDYQPSDLDDTFFESDITVFGGTALTPNIHDKLTEILIKAKQNNCFTIINTVYDFRNEKQNPQSKWPLVKKKAYDLVDLLITDKEEALKISGADTAENAIEYFKSNHAKNVIITQGPLPTIVFASDKNSNDVSYLPISEEISLKLSKEKIKGDTTGCGDNFVGGVIASLAMQMSEEVERLDLQKAVKWGIISGGFACFYYGGAYLESEKGQKYALISNYLKAYNAQSTN